MRLTIKYIEKRYAVYFYNNKLKIIDMDDIPF